MPQTRLFETKNRTKKKRMVGGRIHRVGLDKIVLRWNHEGIYIVAAPQYGGGHSSPTENCLSPTQNRSIAEKSEDFRLNFLLAFLEHHDKIRGYFVPIDRGIKSQCTEKIRQFFVNPHKKMSAHEQRDDSDEISRSCDSLCQEAIDHYIGIG